MYKGLGLELCVKSILDKRAKSCVLLEQGVKDQVEIDLELCVKG